MSPRRFEMVVFDWYRTLAAPTPDDWWQKMLSLIEQAGGRLDAKAFEDWATPAIVHPEHSHSEEAYRRYEESQLDDLLARSSLPEADCDSLRPRILALRDEELVPVFDDVHAILQELRERGLRLAVCSNWSWDLLRHLEHNGIDGYFETVICSAIVGFRKPHPTIFSTLLDAIDCDPAKVAFVGDDWQADVEGALAAGLTPVHLARAACAAAPHEPVACVSDLRGVADLVAP